MTGWVVPKCRWEGIRLSEFLDEVQPKSEAKYVLFSSADGSYTESLTMDQARLADVLLGYKLNGEPLSAEQGYPAPAGDSRHVRVQVHQVGEPDHA